MVFKFLFFKEGGINFIICVFYLNICGYCVLLYIFFVVLGIEARISGKFPTTKLHPQLFYMWFFIGVN
jgi:hypothetical protein